MLLPHQRGLGRHPRGITFGEGEPTMWGITGRGARLGDRRRTARTMQAGLARISVRGPLEHAVLEVAGELDFSNVEQLVALVDALPHRIASIDLASLEFIDGAGARTI